MIKKHIVPIILLLALLLLCFIIIFNKPSKINQSTITNYIASENNLVSIYDEEFKEIE